MKIDPISITMHKTQVQRIKYNPSNTDTETITKWDLLKLKSFYKAKDTINKTK